MVVRETRDTVLVDSVYFMLLLFVLNDREV